jgi:hypothetical protein
MSVLSLPLLYLGLALFASGLRQDEQGWTTIGVLLLLGGLGAVSAAVVGPQRRFWRPLVWMTAIAWLGLLTLLVVVYIGLNSQPT